MTIDEAVALALRHHQSGQLAEAEAIYRQILTVAPRHPDALHLLGVVASQSGRGDLAVNSILQAIGASPNVAVFRSNLGEAYRKLGRMEEAVAAFRSALQIEPQLAAAHSNLGNALRALGRNDEAIVAFRRALELAPAFAEAHYNLANALKELGNFDEAFAAYARSLQLDPAFSEAYNNLAEMLKFRGRHLEAEEAFRRAMALRPDDPEAHSNLLLLLHYLPGRDADECFRESCRWDERHAAPLGRAYVLHHNDPDPARRLRVGYVSSDYREHPVGYFFDGLLSAHDRTQVEIFCYTDVGRGDEVTARLRERAGHWRGIAGLSDEKVAALIREDAIDVLVDLNGHTAHNRLLVFARKPAPVQVTWLGYCDTTGMRTMDFRFTDAYADPPGATDHLYTENLVRLPDTFACFRPRDLSPLVVPAPALARGYVTFGSFHTMAKLNEALAELWAGLLCHVPSARLLIVAEGLGEASVAGKWREFFAGRGVAPGRIAFHDRVAIDAYLALHGEVDVLLDCHPFSGHTVACHALWMGVPVVTLAGKTHCSRMVTSVLMNAGHPEWIAVEPDGYLNIAVALASNLPRLAEIRAALRGQMAASPLMDAARFARNVEDVYRRIWRTWCAARRGGFTERIAGLPGFR